MQTLRETWMILITIPFYSMLIGYEILLNNINGHKFYSRKATLQNVYFTFLNAWLYLLLRWAYYIGILLYCYKRHCFQIENIYLYWLFLFLLEDLAFYIEHRIEHYCRLFWAVPITHHSSEEFNLTAGFRSSVLSPVYRFIYFIPLAFAGFHPLDIVFMYSLIQTYGILLHTQYIRKMPRWFEAIFVIPSHHRVRHASNIRYLDKNMGKCLIIGDKLFGSFQEETAEEPVKYGLTKSITDDKYIINVVFHEWESLLIDIRKMNPMITLLKYIFMPRGWSPDGSSKPASELRKDLLPLKNQQ